jgi:putative transposase
MSSSYPNNPTAAAELLLRAAGLHPGLPFGNLLSATDIQILLHKHSVSFGLLAQHVFNPVVTLWGLFGQCLSDGKDCAAVVFCVIGLRLAFYLDPCSSATGAYCIARAKIPLLFLTELCYLFGDRLEEQAPTAWRWHGRRALLVDGTTLSGPDTAANQKAYPQSRSQKPGLGFPLMRVLVIFGLATGALVGAAIAPWCGKNTGETSLLRRLFERLRHGDILVADRCYGCYCLIAMLGQRVVDVCFRVQQTASVQSARQQGRRLGEGDYLVEWTRPQRPVWMDKETYRKLPATLLLREIHTRVEKTGFRTRNVVVVTTLTALDHEGKPVHKADDVRQLYKDRWHVELDIRCIKTRMKMDVLRGRTPEMMEREIWGHLCVYNQIRRLQAQAAVTKGCLPRQLSFTQAQKQLRVHYQTLSTTDDARHKLLVETMAKGCAARKVGNRPDRYEPRRVKRRPKDSKLLSKPRAQARQDVAAGEEANQPKTRRKKKSATASGQAVNSREQTPV